MATTRWSKRNTYIVQVKFPWGWDNSMNYGIDSPFTNRKKAESAMIKHRSTRMEYRIKQRRAK